MFVPNSSANSHGQDRTKSVRQSIAVSFSTATVLVELLNPLGFDMEQMATGFSHPVAMGSQTWPESPCWMSLNFKMHHITNAGVMLVRWYSHLSHMGTPLVFNGRIPKQNGRCPFACWFSAGNEGMAPYKSSHVMVSFEGSLGSFPKRWIIPYLSTSLSLILKTTINGVLYQLGSKRSGAGGRSAGEAADQSGRWVECGGLITRSDEHGMTIAGNPCTMLGRFVFCLIADWSA